MTVSASREGDSIVIAVADEGEGIAAAELHRVFEPGVRLTSVDQARASGSPSSARSLSRTAAGRRLSSSPGEGATFRLVLPAASDAG